MTGGSARRDKLGATALIFVTALVVMAPFLLFVWLLQVLIPGAHWLIDGDSAWKVALLVLSLPLLVAALDLVTFVVVMLLIRSLPAMRLHYQWCKTLLEVAAVTILLSFVIGPLYVAGIASFGIAVLTHFTEPYLDRALGRRTI